MFLASKLLAFAVEPLFWVLVLLLAGLLLLRRRPRIGNGFIWSAFLSLLISTWPPIPLVYLHYLESRYPQLPADADMHQFVGVVLAGGSHVDSMLGVNPLLDLVLQLVTKPLLILILVAIAIALTATWQIGRAHV